MGRVAVRRVRRHLEHLEPPTPGALLAALAGDWRRDLTNEGFVGGCPLVAAAADATATSDHLRQVLKQAFDGWQEPLAGALVGLGVPEERADGLALVVISALEGALVLARVRRDLAPLDAVVGELGPFLDASCTDGPDQGRA
jgi:hypothetical protein